MSISESTTGHNPIRERKFAGKLYLAIVGAILIAALFSYTLSARRNLSPANLGEAAGTINNDPTGTVPPNNVTGVTGATEPLPVTLPVQNNKSAE